MGDLGRWEPPHVTLQVTQRIHWDRTLFNCGCAMLLLPILVLSLAVFYAAVTHQTP